MAFFYRAWILTALFYFYENFLQVLPSTIRPELALAFSDHSALAYGSMSVAFALAYGLMQIPAGMALDRFKLRFMLPTAWASVACGALILGFSQALWQAIVARVLIGFGSAFAFVGCLKLLQRAQQEEAFSKLTGTAISLGYLGAIGGLSLSCVILAALSWRAYLILMAIIGFICVPVLYFFIHKLPALPLPNPPSIPQNLRYVLKNRSIWIIAIFSSLLFIPSAVWGPLWGIPFLMETHHFKKEVAANCMSYLYIGWIIGAPLWGKLSDRLLKQKPALFGICLGLLFVCLAFIFLNHLSVLFCKILLLSIGMFSSGYLLIYTLIKQNPQNVVFLGSILGVIHTLSCFCAASIQTLVSFMLDYFTGYPTILKYQLAFFTVPFSVFVAILLLSCDCFKHQACINSDLT